MRWDIIIDRAKCRDDNIFKDESYQMPRISDNNVKNRRRKKKKGRVLFARLVFAIFILAAVAAIIFGVYKVAGIIMEGMNDDFTVSTVTVTKKGNLKQTIVEEFDRGVYDEASLKADVDEKVGASNGRVKSEGLEIEGGKAKLKLTYESDDDMAAFNDQVFYADTIEALLSQGISFDSAAINSGGKYAVIVSESMDVLCPKKIVYTDGAITIDKDNPKLAHCTVNEGDIAFLIY